MSRRWMRLLPVLVVGLIVAAWYITSLRELTINYDNVSRVDIYKTSDLDSGQASSPKTTINQSGQKVKLFKGGYTAYYVGKDGYESRYVAINLSQDRSIDIKPAYSKEKIDSILDAELPNIQATILASQPPNISLYALSRGALYHNGSWYGTTLKYTGDDEFNSDTLRIILHKEQGQWVVKTALPKIVFNIYEYPDIPRDVLRAVNNQ